MDGLLDEAFLRIHETLLYLNSFEGVYEDKEKGIRQRLTSMEIETPVELDIVCSDGELEIGMVPPLYRVETTIEPVFHHIKLKVVAVINNE
jgi:hypothetical protein